MKVGMGAAMDHQFVQLRRTLWSFCVQRNRKSVSFIFKYLEEVIHILLK